MQILDPKLDVVFKMLFAAEENRDILRAFLEAVLKPETPIREIEVLNPELPKDWADDKGLILDLRLRMESGELVNVELQRVGHPALFPLVLGDWSRRYLKKLSRGGEYLSPAPAVVVLVADFASFPWSDGYHHVFGLRERQEHFPLGDHMRVHVLSLPRLPRLEDAAADDDVVNWGRFFKSGSDPVVLEESSMRSPELDKARRALLALSGNPEARERAERRFMDRYFYELGLETTRAEGEVAGRAAGEVIGRAEAVLAVCAARGVRLTAEQTERVLACRDLEQLERWLRSASTAEEPGDVFI
jgi:predicted transposase/invertase (TIGR01784 family)